MASLVLIWTEALDEKGRIIFQWNGRAVLVEEAFSRLQKTLGTAEKNHTRVTLVIKGSLGHDVRWDAAFASHSGQAVRHVFAQWYTQAVQAQAALAKQRVMRPSVRG